MILKAEMSIVRPSWQNLKQVPIVQKISNYLTLRSKLLTDTIENYRNNFHLPRKFSTRPSGRNKFKLIHEKFQ